MKKIYFILGFLGLLLSPQLANAQSQRNPCFYPAAATGGCIPVSTNNPLPVNASVSASIAGFTPSLSFATLTATASSASVALPTNTGTVAFQNTGAATVSCTLGVGSATAVANQIQVPASSTVFVTPGSNTFGACIDQTGSTSNLIVLAGGVGLGAGFGGGGGGGGSSAITTWGGATLGAATGWGIAPSGNVIGVNANIVVGPATQVVTVADGSDVAEGATSDAAAAAGGAGSVSAKLRLATTQLNTLNTTVATAANQTTGNTSLATIATNSALPLPAQSNFTTNIGSVTLNDANSNAVLNDPCQTATKVYTPINVVTATNTIITGVSAKKKYICGIFLYPAGTTNVAIFQATTATACVTALVGVIGGTTTATGIIMTAQAGFVLGTGVSSVAATTVNQTDLCIVTSAAVQVSGVVVTVDR